jgi:predicted dehydrogenase
VQHSFVNAARQKSGLPISGPTGLRVGVIGSGYWGAKHARVLNALDDVAAVAVIDRDGSKVARLVQSFPGVVGYTSLDEALDHVDAMVIATPPSTHAPLAMRLIEAGKHVLVEKPMATVSSDARAMIAAADAKGVALMVGHTFEYHSAVWKLRDMVHSKEIGDLFYLDTARLNLGLYQSDVNVILDLAPHDVSILNYILGRPPVSVQCWASRHAHRYLEDVAYLRLSYADPAVFANIHVSWLDPCKVRRVTLVGSKKMVVYNDLASEERIRIHDKGVLQMAVQGDDTRAPMSYRYGDVVAPYLTMNEPLVVEDGHFVDSILSGTRPMTDGANGLAVVEILEAAQLSLDEGRPVEIAEIRQATPPGGIWLPTESRTDLVLPKSEPA